MKHRHLLVYLALVFLCVWGGTSAFAEDADMNAYTKNTPIQAVIHDPAFGDYGRLIFPVDEGYMSGDTLGSLRGTTTSTRIRRWKSPIFCARAR